MDPDESGEVTLLLQALKAGRPGAEQDLLSRVYAELRSIARNRIGSAESDPTTLVHEAYVRMFGREDASWENRRHFYWAASRAMRDILVERARAARTLKRGGDRRAIELEDSHGQAVSIEADDLLTLHEVLERLESVHPLSARVVTLRFFGGLSREEIAEDTGLSPAAVWREWEFAKAWLYRKMAVEGDQAFRPQG